MISIIIPILNEGKYISDCIDSILNQDNPGDEIEILCIDGMSTDNTRSVIQDIIKSHSNIRLLDNVKKTVPHALNIGILESKGEIIVRIDAHCIYQKNYVSRLVKEIHELDADNVGGILQTLPACPSALCLSIAIASSHKFGVGNSLYKTGSSKITQTDTVPFGCFNRHIFDKIGLFDTDLIRNQDDEFNARIIKSGGRIFIIPDIITKYYARDNPGKISKMYFQYGLFKPLVNKKIGYPATIRQLIPPLFVAGLFSGFILSFFSGLIELGFICIILIYSGLSLFVSLQIAINRKRPSLFFLLPLTFFLIHISYGSGYLYGMVKFLIIRQKSTTVLSNR